MTVSCSACGQEWPRDPALEVSCPTCAAPIGRRCQRPSQHNVYGNQLHPQRDRAAMAAGLLEICKASDRVAKADRLPLFAEAAQ